MHTCQICSRTELTLHESHLNRKFGIFFLDINECHVNDLAQEHVVEYSHNCHADANCTNTKGSFYCTCHHGYYGDGVTCQGMKYTLDTCQRCFQEASR